MESCGYANYCTKDSDLRRLSANTAMLAVRTFDV